MLPAFPRVLRRALDDAGILPVDFARRMRVSPSSVYGVLSGNFRPPGDGKKLAAWAEELGLKGRKAEDFIVSAHLDRSPELLRRVALRWRRAAGM